MTLQYRFDHDGALYVRSDDLGTFSYSYPGSYHAATAARSPRKAAAIAREIELGAGRFADQFKSYPVVTATLARWEAAWLALDTPITDVQSLA